MATTVPRLTGPSVASQAMPGVRITPSAEVDAFGGGKSTTQAFDSISNFGGEVAKMGLEEKKKADQVAFMSADKAASDLETSLQIQALKMKKADAFGAPDVVSQQWKDGVDKIRVGLANDDQRMAFDRSVNLRAESLNKAVQLHVSQQSQEYDNDETAGHLASSKTAAVLNAMDDQRIGLEIARQNSVLTDWAKRNGVPPDSDTFKSKVVDTLSGTHIGVIDARLDNGQVNGAKAYFEANKAQMSATDLLKAEKAIDEKDAITQGMSAWNSVQGYKLADGNPDEAKMQSAIMARSDLSDAKKEKVWDFVKARAAETIANKTRTDQATDRSFMNTVLSARQQGVPLDQALSLSSQYGGDPYTQATRAEAIKKVYAPPTESNVATKYALWEGIQEGKTTNAQLDEALQKNDLSSKDWFDLKQDRYKAEIEGRSPEMKSARERVKILAVQTFGTNEAKRMAFELEVNEAARGKSPDEYWKIALDKAKTDPSTESHFLWMNSMPFGGDYQSQTDASKRDAARLAFGKAKQDLGAETVQAIGLGFARKGSATFTPADLDAFSQEFGGYQKIQPGTPVNNAIKSLMQRNKPVVPENIKAVLERYPDGRF